MTAHADSSLDALERRYARIYPLARMGRTTLQFFATLTLLGFAVLFAGLLIDLAMYATGASGARALSIWLAGKAGFLVGMCIGGSYNLALDLVNRMWRPVGVFWGAGGLLALYLNVPSFLPTLDYVLSGEAVLALPEEIQLAFGFALVALFAYYLWVVPITVLRGAFAVLSASREQAALLRETPSGRRSVVHSLLGLPPLTDFARASWARYASVVVLTLLTSLFLASAALGVMASPIWLFNTYINARQLYPDLVWPLFAAPFWFAGIFMAVSVIGRIIERIQLGRLRFSLEELQKVDRRLPVLFLRAFGDDQVTLREPRLPHLARALDFGRRRTNLDELLLAEGTPYGPLVALGNPSDRFPPYGAARQYFDNKTWQQAVQSLAQESSVIVLCVDATDGIWWEVEHIAATRQFAKTLFLIHPAHREPSANRALLTRLAAVIGDHGVWLADMAKSDAGGKAQSVCAFYIDETGSPAVMRSSSFSRFAYLLAIRTFVRGKLGMPKERLGNP